MTTKVYRHKRTRKFYQAVEVQAYPGEFIVTCLLGGSEGEPYGPGQPRSQAQLDKNYTLVDLEREFGSI